MMQVEQAAAPKKKTPINANKSDGGYRLFVIYQEVVDRIPMIGVDVAAAGVSLQESRIFIAMIKVIKPKKVVLGLHILHAAPQARGDALGVPAEDVHDECP